MEDRLLTDQEITNIYDKEICKLLPNGKEALYYEEVEQLTKNGRREIARAQDSKSIRLFIEEIEKLMVEFAGDLAIDPVEWQELKNKMTK